MAEDDERVNEHLSAYGLRPRQGDLPAIRSVLAGEAARERAAYDEGGDADLDAGGDTDLMKLCCVQLFNCGGLADTLLIWRAKEVSFRHRLRDRRSTALRIWTEQDQGLLVR